MASSQDGPSSGLSQPRRTRAEADGVEDQKCAERIFVARMPRAAHPEDRPGCRARQCGERQPPPALEARDRERRRLDHDEIGEQAPGVGIGRDDQGGCDEAAEHAEQRHEHALQQRQPDGNQRDGGERQQRRERAEQMIERVGGVDALVKAMNRPDAVSARRHVSLAAQRQSPSATAERREPLAAGRGERGAEQEAERAARGGAEIAFVDGVFDEEGAGERDGDGTQPDEPARGERLFQILRAG